MQGLNLKMGLTNFIKGKQIFIQGSPILKTQKGIKIGRLSVDAERFSTSKIGSNSFILLYEIILFLV